MSLVTSPEIQDPYAALDALDVSTLHLKREQIRAEYPDFNLPDDKLAELIAITRLLRKKLVASGGAPRKAKGPKGPTTLEDLA